MTTLPRRRFRAHFWFTTAATALWLLLPAARETARAQQPPAPADAGRPIEGLALTVGLSAEAQKSFRKELADEGADAFPIVDYTLERDKETARITPRLLTPAAGNKKSVDYLTLLEKGGPIEPIIYSPEYSVSFPNLDLKVVNNGAKTVFFSEIQVQVQSSQPDPTPLVLIFSGYSQTLFFQLMNEGWMPIESCTVKYNLFPKKAKPPAGDTFAFEKTLGRFTESVDVDIGDAAIKSGVSPKYVEKVRQYLAVQAKQNQLMEVKLPNNADPTETPEYLKTMEVVNKLYTELTTTGKKQIGPFTGGEGRVAGVLTYAWKDAAGQDQSKTVRFQADVLILPPEGLGAAGPVTGRYETMLRTQGDNYTLRVPVSQPVRKGEVDRFLLRLGLPASSRHQFRVRLRSTDGGFVESGPISLAGLLPRNAAAELQRQAEARQEEAGAAATAPGGASPRPGPSPAPR